MGAGNEMGKIDGVFKNKKHKLTGLYGSCALVGLFTGLTVVALRFSLGLALEIRTARYRNFVENFNVDTVSLWVLYFLGISVFLYFSTKYFPNIKGGGIPLTRANLLKQVEFSWLKELILKFTGTILTIGNGLSLGRKGPSVQLGALVGDGIHKLLKRKEYEKKYFVSCGAAAGISAAFNAPLAGVIFSLEELNRFFSPTLVTCVMIASVMGDIVTRGVFGLHPAFSFNLHSTFNLIHYPTIILLALVSSLLGIYFNRSFIKLKKIYADLTIHPIIKIFCIFLLAFSIGIMYTKFLGIGYSLADSMFNGSFPYRLLFLFLGVKFFFTLICSASGVPGGIFLPMLLIGSLIGRIYGEMMFRYFSLDEGYIIYFVVLGMASFFTAVARTPITASVLMLEMTGSFEHFFPLIVCSMIAFLVTEIAGSRSIYDFLLEDLLKNQRTEGNKDKKITLLIPVASNSKLDSTRIKDTCWPSGSLVVCIGREDKEFIPHGNTLIEGGDILTLLIDENSAHSAKMKLFKLGEESFGENEL